jgi:hypothetical protein
MPGQNRERFDERLFRKVQSRRQPRNIPGSQQDMPGPAAAGSALQTFK